MGLSALILASSFLVHSPAAENATNADNIEVGAQVADDFTTAAVRKLLSQNGVSVLSWHSSGAEDVPIDLLESVFPGMLSFDVDAEASGIDSLEAYDEATDDDSRWKGHGGDVPLSEAMSTTLGDHGPDGVAVTGDEVAEQPPMTMAEKLKRLRTQRVAEAEGVPSAAGVATDPSSKQSSRLSSQKDSLSNVTWASTADIDSRSNYSNSRPNASIDIAKLAWLHFPKAGTSFANTLVSFGCPGLDEQDIVDNSTADGSGAYVWGFMGVHKKQCHEEFQVCGGHAPIKDGGGCNAWERHQGNFVALFRQPEQRIISGFNQNCHDIAGDNCTLTGYAKKVSGCSVKMMTGRDCGADGPITLDQVSTAIQRLDTGFAFVGLTEEWALSVCLFHAMFGGQCHDREFLNVRPGKKHALMRYDTAGLEGWTDAYDGAVYTHASTIFRNNIAKYGVTPDTCRQDICANAAEAFESALFGMQR